MKTISTSSWWAMLVYEFLGTAILTYSYCLGQNSAQIRAFAYFTGFIIAFQVSGAHFNPAVSLAVFIIERSCQNMIGLLATIFTQFAGAFFGILISYLFAKDAGYFYRLLPSITIIPFDPSSYTFIYNQGDTIFWGRIVLQEVLQTFIFTLIFLVVSYDAGLRKVDRILKGFIVAFTMVACLSMNMSSGASFNPAFAMAESCLMIAMDNRDGLTTGSDEAKYMWPYVTFPFLGAIFAALVYLLHCYIDNMGRKSEVEQLKESSPMQSPKSQRSSGLPEAQSKKQSREQSRQVSNDLKEDQERLMFANLGNQNSRNQSHQQEHQNELDKSDKSVKSGFNAQE